MGYKNRKRKPPLAIWTSVSYSLPTVVVNEFQVLCKVTDLNLSMLLVLTLIYIVTLSNADVPVCFRMPWFMFGTPTDGTLPVSVQLLTTPILASGGKCVRRRFRVCRYPADTNAAVARSTLMIFLLSNADLSLCANTVCFKVISFFCRSP